MKMTMCCTSWIVPVTVAGSMAIARRMDSGSSAVAATVPRVPAEAFRKWRRSKVLMDVFQCEAGAEALGGQLMRVPTSALFWQAETVMVLFEAALVLSLEPQPASGRSAAAAAMNVNVQAAWEGRRQLELGRASEALLGGACRLGVLLCAAVTERRLESKAKAKLARCGARPRSSRPRRRRAMRCQGVKGSHPRRSAATSSILLRTPRAA